MDAGESDLGLADPESLPSPAPGAREFAIIGRGRPPIGRLRRSSVGEVIGRRASSGKATLRRTIPLPTIPDLDVLVRLRRYIVALAVVLFDLDEGPLLDNVVPSEARFDETELAAISFLSMPDSTMSSFSGTRYTVRRARAQATRAHHVAVVQLAATADVRRPGATRPCLLSAAQGPDSRSRLHPALAGHHYPPRSARPLHDAHGIA